MRDELTRRLDEAEDYEQTVKVLLAFGALVVHDGRSVRPGAEFGLGRRMTPLPQDGNTAVPCVTPDLVAQKSTSYGVLAEAKKSLPRDQVRWNAYVKQLRKYRQDLEGWWTTDERIATSDVVILIHYSRSRAFGRFLESLDEDELSVVEFHRSAERIEYIAFRLEHGEIQDKELAGPLGDAVEVPFEKVLSSFPNIKYYDSEPPLPLLLTNLWIDAFPSMIEGRNRDESLGAYRLDVRIRDLAGELQKAYGSGGLRRDSRSVEFPKESWIRKGLDALVSYGLAVPSDSESDRYEIHYRKLQGDILARFVELETRHSKSTQRQGGNVKGQEALFPELFGNGG